MATLFGALDIASSSLDTQQAAMEVTSNNIANVNTPGYSREIADMADIPPLAGAPFGGGVELAQVQSVRDNVLDLRVDQETQTQNQLTAYQGQMNPVQALFSTSTGAGLNTAIDNFFNSLQQLSTQPSNGAARQTVLGNAQSMAQAFQQVSSAVTQQQSDANQAVVQDVTQVNNLTQQIAALNNQIGSAQDQPNSIGPLTDQRSLLLSQLSQYIGFTVTNAGKGQVNVSTSNGDALVTGDQASTLSTVANNATGMQDVMDQGVDITDSIGGGDIGGLVQARDSDLPTLLTQLNNLASGIASAVNTQNKAGFDLNGNAGGNLISIGDANNPAATLGLATQNPSAIAASSDGTQGSNGNALLLAGLQQQNIVNGQTPDTAYAGLVSTVGNFLSSANAQQQASSAVLTQLQNQQSSVSGVSLNEESINLTQFQNAYQAAAQVVNVINTCMQTAIAMGTAVTTA